MHGQTTLNSIPVVCWFGSLLQAGRIYLKCLKTRWWGGRGILYKGQLRKLYCSPDFVRSIRWCRGGGDEASILWERWEILVTGLLTSVKRSFVLSCADCAHGSVKASGCQHVNHNLIWELFHFLSLRHSLLTWPVVIILTYTFYFGDYLHQRSGWSFAPF